MSNHLKKEHRKNFELVFKQSSGKVFNFVLSVSNGNRYLAEEVTQIAFQRLWEQIDSSATVEHMTSYLYASAKNIMFNLCRHETVKWIYESYLTQQVDISNMATDQAVDMSFMMQYVDAILIDMPPMRRAVFEMSKLQGYTIKEISRQLNVSMSSVATHLQLGLSFMRQELRKRYGIIMTMSLSFSSIQFLQFM